jgi:hypothetical protein
LPTAAGGLGEERADDAGSRPGGQDAPEQECLGRESSAAQQARYLAERIRAL